MPYVSADASRQYALDHYAKNKAAYNPGRKLVRSMAKEARRRVSAQSMEAWVSPKRMGAICQSLPHWWQLQTALMRSAVYEGCVAGFPGSKEGGVFLGRSPFMPALKFGPKKDPDPLDEWCRRKFIKSLRYVTPRNCSAELLILKITIEGQIFHGC